MKKNKLILCAVMFLSVIVLSGCQMPKFLDKNDEDNNIVDNDQNDSVTSDNESNNKENNDDNSGENNLKVKYAKLDMEKYNSLPTPVTIKTTKDLPGKSIGTEISSTLKEQLYKYIIFDTATNDGYISDLYRNEKTTVNDLSENEILLIALRDLVKCKDNSDDDYDYFHYEADIRDLGNKIIELYGFDPISGSYPIVITESEYGGWNYSNGKYAPGAGGPLSCFTEADLRFPVVDIREDDNNLYIYTEVYFYEAFQDYSSVYGNYEDYIDDSKLGSILASDGYIWYFEGEDEYNNRFDFLKNKYPKVIHTYKHTFEKKPDGGYRWVSSEPLTK